MYCERFKCSLNKKVCVDRQEQAEVGGNHSFDGCLDCEQGQRVRQELHGKVVGKLCARCKQMKPLDAYGKSSTSRDGLHAYCKECVAAYGKEKREKNKKEMAEMTGGKDAEDTKNHEAQGRKAEDRKTANHESSAISHEKLDHRAEALANEHWKFLGGLIKCYDDATGMECKLSFLEYLYKHAMVHGYKHALQDMRGKGGEKWVAQMVIAAHRKNVEGLRDIFGS